MSNEDRERFRKFLERDMDAQLEIVKAAAQKEAKKEPGSKHDFGKPPLDLLPAPSLIAIARVLEFGRGKYGAWNWRGGMSWSRPYAAALRHLLAWSDGEDADPETGLSHLAHAGCCILFLLTLRKEHPELDDRYKKDPT
jgi:hypothetical protein